MDVSVDDVIEVWRETADEFGPEAADMEIEWWKYYRRALKRIPKMIIGSGVSPFNTAFDAGAERMRKNDTSGW